ncbi:MAG: inorganic phosphate transporter, partial [Planctomycetaceae bacterium]|nr:inorganic phosphate transporter [Planctomycetaceae bacterium]
MAAAPVVPRVPQIEKVPDTGAVHEKFNRGPHKAGVFIFGALFVVGIVYALSHLLSDISQVHHPSSYAFLLLGVALLVALGFEFVNGFHDTANAVATVIYTHSMDPHVAVAWSGFWNFLGVVLSTGVVAFSIISLLPVELI